MTFPENLTISVESASRSRSLLLQHLRLGRSSPSLELPAEMQLLPEQLGSSKLESRLRGTRLGHRAEQSSARAVCGREGTLEEGTQGSSPPGHFPPSYTHLVLQVPMQLLLGKFLMSTCFTPSAI